MSEDFVRNVKTLLASGRGDTTRLCEILDTIRQGNPVYMSDYKYVVNLEDPDKSREGEGLGMEVQDAKAADPIELLRMRLAEGSITVEEFRQIKREISGL